MEPPLKESARKNGLEWSFLLNLRVNTVHFGKEPFAPFALRSIHRHGRSASR